jgi:hypothetical protein
MKEVDDMAVTRVAACGDGSRAVVAAHWARIAETVAQRDDLLAALDALLENEDIDEVHLCQHCQDCGQPQTSGCDSKRIDRPTCYDRQQALLAAIGAARAAIAKAWGQR